MEGDWKRLWGRVHICEVWGRGRLAPAAASFSVRYKPVRHVPPPPGADSVAALIAKHLSRVVERPPAPPLPVYTFQPHSQPRCVEWGNGRMHRQ